MSAFVSVYKDEYDNQIIECSGYIHQIEIDTPSRVENIYIISGNCKPPTKGEIEKYFDEVWIKSSYCEGFTAQYNGCEEDILRHSTEWIPVGFLFSLYGSNRALYSIQIKDLNLKEMGYLDVDFSFGYGTELTGYMWLNDSLIFGGHDVMRLITNKSEASVKIVIHSEKDIRAKFDSGKKLRKHLVSCYGLSFMTELTLEYYNFIKT